MQDRAAALAQDAKAEWHFRLGLASARMQDWAAAVSAYEAAIARDGSKPEWHFHLGLAREKIRNWRAAVLAYEAAIARDDGKPEWHFHLGLAREKIRNWRAAVLAYEAAIARNDGKADWRFRLGFTQERMKDWAAAASAYEAAIARDHRNGDWHFRLGTTRERTKDWSAAASAYEAAIARNNGRADWHFRLGITREKTKDWTAAASAYEAAIARNDGKADWHFRLGITREKTKDWVAAASAYEAAIARNDGKADWHFHLGFVRQKLHDWAAAVVAYEAGITRDDRRGEWHFRLASARQQMQDWLAASSAYGQALRRDYCNDLCRYRLALCLQRQGLNGDAWSALSPTIATNDRLLIEFLSSSPYGTKANVISSDVLFGGGTRTILDRRVVVETEKGHKTYFEHSVHPESYETVSAFYTYLKRKFGGTTPSFIPPLRHCSSTSSYGYFLYDYVKPSPSVWSCVFSSDDKFDTKLGRGITDHLVSIKNEFKDFERGIHTGATTANISLSHIYDFLENEIKRNHGDHEYTTLLRLFRAKQESHYENYKSFPSVFCHGDACGKNVIITKKREIYIVDWDAHGWGPIGIDLVTLMANRLDSVVFEDLCDYYFDKIDERISPRERRYIIALLATCDRIVENQSLSRKWLRYATRR